MELIETKLELLQGRLLDMAHLVKTQVQNSKKALLEKNNELADEVIAKDEEVDGFELKISQNCEQILALYNPVAIDLRFILASIKISLSLERIGDLAEGVCHLIKGIKKEINPLFLEAFKLEEMLDMAILMLDDIILSIKVKDTKLAKQIFKKDLFLNKAYHKSIKIGSHQIKGNPTRVKTILILLSMVRKVERMGDLAKNISEEIIFHHEAKLPKKNPMGKNNKKNF
jgi:phosphate transport system protein